MTHQNLSVSYKLSETVSSHFRRHQAYIDIYDLFNYSRVHKWGLFKNFRANFFSVITRNFGLMNFRSPIVPGLQFAYHSCRIKIVVIDPVSCSHFFFHYLLYRSTYIPVSLVLLTIYYMHPPLLS